LKVAQKTITIGGLTLPLCGSLTKEQYDALYPADVHVWSTLIAGSCYYTTVAQIGQLVDAGLI
jgi:hypothetical protein